ncbi:MAG: histidine triad nucleotide-binding protein [Candidatus Eisenbacteria bacterium]|uniref:Histidine triad nucleotide-binding protein n=1 Tax=Eiseniibacteriota bacterium TaxID=2212470 RepID=A0A948RVY1_UNCEI|nr:histidine triad nucleotide-binding protein [Candidatus Eisenbacteria bacterium]MBU1951087.1 histidine triad nucleotide-binding protein [Candidatus Eisenbacteria bacterium]MBU2690553.1 histidine triad nucleotide-binding protein [Candidatus Eisenbacteria bacterium]
MKDCLFCRIIAGEIPADKVYEDDLIIAFRDVNPQAPTHILLIPKEHIATVNDLQKDHAELIGHIHLQARALAASEGIDELGYRIVVNCLADAGQSVFHLHFHLLGGRSMKWPPG